MPLTQERPNTHERMGRERALGVAANAVIYAGAGTVLNAAGYLVPAGSAAGITMGRAEETVNNTGGANGARKCRVRAGVFVYASGTSGDAITAQDVGKPCYWIDDATVGLTDGGGARSLAGTIFAVDAEGVSVALGMELADPILASGTYAPTLAGVTNVDGTPTASLAHWTRIGNIVRVDAVLSVDPTAGSDTSTVASMSLPVASNLGSASLVGTAARPGTVRAGSVAGDAATDTARLTFLAGGTSAETWHVSFSYQVLPAA